MSSYDGVDNILCLYQDILYILNIKITGNFIARVTTGKKYFRIMNCLFEIGT